MSRYKKYRSDKALREAVEGYFASISRVRQVMEERRTGELDRYGHFVMELVPVLDGRGQPMMEREFVLPPTVGGLCAHLGISRETWAQYCGLPQFEETAGWARETLRLYLEQQLLTREGKNLQGVLFSLQNNYGMSEKKTVELGPQAAKAVAETGMSLSERKELLLKLADDLRAEEASPSRETGTEPSEAGPFRRGGAAE